MGSEKLIELKFARVLDEILILHISTLERIVASNRLWCDMKIKFGIEKVWNKH